MVYVDFFKNVEAIYLGDGVSDILYDDIEKFLIEFPAWRIHTEELYPNSGCYSIKEVIKQLKSIVQYLNDKGILWTGRPVSFNEFTCDDFPGFFVIEKDIVAFSYIIGPGEISTEYIPLGKSQKLL